MNEGWSLRSCRIPGRDLIRGVHPLSTVAANAGIASCCPQVRPADYLWGGSPASIEKRSGGSMEVGGGVVGPLLGRVSGETSARCGRLGP